MKTILMATTLSALVCPLYAQPADGPLALVRDEQGEVAIAITRLKWMSFGEFQEQQKQKPWGDATERVLAVEYEIKPLGGDWKRAGAPINIVKTVAHDDRDIAALRLYGSSGGGRGRAAWGKFNPTAKNLTLTWDIGLPDAPPASAARSDEAVVLRGVPLPVSWEGISKTKPFVVQNFAATTQRGTRVVLDSLWLQGAATPDASDDRLVLNFALFPSPTVPDMEVGITTEKLLDNSGGDLMKGQRINAQLKAPRAGVVAQPMTMQTAPTPEAKTLDLQIKIAEDAPSLQQQRWFRHLEYTFAAADLDAAPPLEVAPPLAQTQGERSAATVESIKSIKANGNDYYRLRIWLKTAAKAATPPNDATRWQLKSIAARNSAPTPDNPAYDLPLGQPAGATTHSDGTPVAAGESGFDISLPIADSKAVGKVDLTLVAAPTRTVTRQFSVENLKFPTEPGAMLAPHQVFEHADGSRLIVHKVGRFDTIHQPLLGPFSQRPGPLDWQGLVVVMEFVPADRIEVDKSTRFSFRKENAIDDAGREIGPANNKDGTSAFGSHSGDVWKELPPGATPGQLPAGEKFKFGPLVKDDGQMERTRQSWSSAFFEVPDQRAQTLSFAVSVEEIWQGAEETIIVKDVALPAP